MRAHGFLTSKAATGAWPGIPATCMVVLAVVARPARELSLQGNARYELRTANIAPDMLQKVWPVSWCAESLQQVLDVFKIGWMFVGCAQL